ncbi:RNA polymerase sigma factor [Solirubrobacter sp. CPCC 204708]|uniref:RNA polymerase sigma factor n=1 Tax=Solirubrobacter deserti TaxID=2282478 RepID=A0ABT4RVG1_9ACTN|nr:RNA polymerase sigma factor [Solirubrobacter deserti]MBE2317710.1 RNA polymerase sigma factor [Solirubrobacter deserti]MDA0142571.1 RNA polymerase sigma factor [Solirubrobacter deserti]
MLASPAPEVTVRPRPLRPEAIVRHLDRLHHVARALCRSPHEAEDLVQDTCLQLLRTRRELRRADELPYLLTALRRTHVTRRRAAARRPRTVDLGDAPEHALAGRSPGLLDQVGEREVLRWISALPRESRIAVVAVDVAGLSRADAARVLGVRERRLSEQLSRGRAGLAARLAPEPKDQGGSWTPSPRAGASMARP